MTEKLYENDSLLRTCTGVVTACTGADGKYLVELDRTVFFPEGGGQLSDRGKINDVAVSHVTEKDGHILHECSAPLVVGTQVNVVLDWSVRLDRMQQHSGEHILSYACWKLFKALNVGFHMNEERVFIDLDKEITDEELEQAETLANEIVWDNRPITVQYLPHDEAAKLKDKMRKFNDKLRGILRLVTVKDADVCTCCGTHPPFTGMIGMIKVISKVKHKGGCRIEFVCGGRALQYTSVNLKILNTVAESLSTSAELIMDSLQKQKHEKMQLQIKLANANKMVLRTRLENSLANALKAGNCLFCCLSYDGLDGREEKCLQDLLEEHNNVLLLFLNSYGGRLRYSLLRSAGCDADCGKLLRELNPLFNGKGGGKQDFAQGSTELSENLAELMQQAQAKLRSLV